MRTSNLKIYCDKEVSGCCYEFKQDTLEVQYMSALSKQRLKICSNDKDILSQKSVVQILQCPSLKCDIYHFNKALDVDMI